MVTSFVHLSWFNGRTRTNNQWVLLTQQNGKVKMTPPTFHVVLSKGLPFMEVILVYVVFLVCLQIYLSCLFIWLIWSSDWSMVVTFLHQTIQLMLYHKIFVVIHLLTWQLVFQLSVLHWMSNHSVIIVRVVWVIHYHSSGLYQWHITQTQDVIK